MEVTLVHDFESASPASLQVSIDLKGTLLICYPNSLNVQAVSNPDSFAGRTRGDVRDRGLRDHEADICPSSVALDISHHHHLLRRLRRVLHQLVHTPAVGELSIERTKPQETPDKSEVAI